MGLVVPCNQEVVWSTRNLIQSNVGVVGRYVSWVYVGVMCAEGMVCGAISQFSFLGEYFLQVCDSSQSSGHGQNPHMTKMIMSTTRLNDAIHTL